MRRASVRVGLAWLPILATALSSFGCAGTELANGLVACTTSADCPTSYFCAADGGTAPAPAAGGTCYKVAPSTPDATIADAMQA